MGEPSLVRQPFVVKIRPGDDAIHGDVRYPLAQGNLPVVIVCHSFMAFKDWGFFPHVGEKIAKAGFVTVMFNFSRNGVVDSGDRISDFARFESNTFTQELKDLESVIHAIMEGMVAGDVADRNRVVLLGHSRGGGIAIVHTARDERVKALVTWSAVSRFDRWTLRQKDEWQKRGFLSLARDSTVSPLRLDVNLLHDLERNRERLDIVAAAGRIGIPWLILHGKADVTVPCHEAESLYRSANKTSTELVLLDRVGHLYNATSYDEDQSQTINHIIDLTIHWLQRTIL